MCIHNLLAQISIIFNLQEGRSNQNCNVLIYTYYAHVAQAVPSNSELQLATVVSEHVSSRVAVIIVCLTPLDWYLE